MSAHAREFCGRGRTVDGDELRLHAGALAQQDRQLQIVLLDRGVILLPEFPAACRVRWISRRWRRAAARGGGARGRRRVGGVARRRRLLELRRGLDGDGRGALELALDGRAPGRGLERRGLGVDRAQRSLVVGDLAPQRRGLPEPQLVLAEPASWCLLDRDAGVRESRKEIVARGMRATTPERAEPVGWRLPWATTK